MWDKLLAAQKEMSNPKKDKTADAGRYAYNYADLAQVLSIILPALHNNGLGLQQRIEYSEDKPYLVTSVFDESDKMELSRFQLKVYADMQAHGSALTYARRYELLTVFGLAAEDDDGKGSKFAPTVDDELKAAQQFLLQAEKTYCWQHGDQDPKVFHQEFILTRKDYRNDVETLTRIANELLTDVG